ncbi:hypothetical protein KAJ27_04230 [bacterium]|nr:hypothetical protein [bacterium]
MSRTKIGKEIEKGLLEIKDHLAGKVTLKTAKRGKKKQKNDEIIDSELILSNPVLTESIYESKEDLKEGREYSHQEMLEELDKNSEKINPK